MVKRDHDNSIWKRKKAKFLLHFQSLDAEHILRENTAVDGVPVSVASVIAIS